MTQESSPTPSSSPAHLETHLSRWMVVLLIFAVICIFFAVWLYVTFPKTKPPLVPLALSNATQQGDYQQAVNSVQEVLNNENASVEKKAIATLNYMGARYRVSGDMNDHLLDIRDIKPVILNTAVSAQTRANALAWLAGAHESFGRPSEIFAEIYKDAPFNQYLVAGDPDASARKLFEWSYSISPNAYAAISIARWYALAGVLQPETDAATRDSYNKLAADYLALADKLSLQEEQKEPVRYLAGLRYLQFRSFRMVVIGGLARQGVEPFASDYRKPFDEYISFSQSSQHVLAPGFLVGVRLAYAFALANDGDTAAAKEQLDKIAAQLSAAQPSPKVRDSILTFQNQKKYESGTTRWKLIENMYNISPDFKAAMESILAAK